jgi:nucleoid DNA-binding protein
MKFDKYVADYLYQHKELTLAGLGTFSTAENFAVPADSKTAHFPAEGILFNWERNAVTSEDFNNYLFASIKKPITVILADFDDFLLQVKSLLGSGKSVVIHGLGTLHKNGQTGEISFEHGAATKEKLSFTSYDSEKYVVKSKPATLNKKKLAVFMGSLIMLFVVSFLVWAFYTGRIKFPGSENKPIAQTVPETVPDTLPKTLPVNVATKDTVTVPANDTMRYRMIFLATKYREKALKKLGEFVPAEKVQYDSAIMRDTLRYRLYIYKKSLPTDTLKVKSLLETYFKHYIIIEEAK